MEQKNNITQDDSEWKVVKEPYINSISNELMERVTLKRKDGFSIGLIGAAGKGLDDVFLVKGNFGEFEIRTSRLEQRDPIGSEKFIEAGGYLYVISDTYVVYIQYCRRPEAGKNDKELFKIYSKDIESALMNYPVKNPAYKSTPIKNVIFDVGEKWTTPHYVQAKDL